MSAASKQAGLQVNKFAAVQVVSTCIQTPAHLICVGLFTLFVGEILISD